MDLKGQLPSLIKSDVSFSLNEIMEKSVQLLGTGFERLW